jgi:hypothetical protein
MLGGSQRYQASLDHAKRAFARADDDYQERDAARQLRLPRPANWSKAVAEAKRQADAHNAHVDWLAVGFRQHDRFAVSEYIQMVLDRSP